jgi:hypothetical protein
MRTHIARMAHIIQLGLGVFITNLGKMAAWSRGQRMSAISNLERMKA